MAVCAGGAGLAPEDRAELLAVLAGDSDENIAQRAANALLSLPLDAFLTALERPDAAPQLFGYAAENLAEKPGIADAMANNPGCPPDPLTRASSYLSAAAVQALAEDLDRLSTAPALIAALSASPFLTAEQRKSLEELQEEGGDEAALSEAVAAVEPDNAKRLSLYQKVSRMRVIERVQLALKGNREERMLLIHNANKMVQRAVLQSPRITEQEVEGFAAMASLGDEILRMIGSNRAFVKNYVVARNLVNNPKTPLEVSLHLLPRLTPQDLKFLTMNKNVPEILRTMATKLQRQRSQAKPGGG